METKKLGNDNLKMGDQVKEIIATGRDHLFINYATEDSDLAEWITLKLTSEGYRVWCDKFKLLGGESYPRDIDEAIKKKTFRFISLLSHSSINKPNPLKERTLALNLSRERNEDFIIPLKVDDIKVTELDWMTSDLTYIPFNESWSVGFKQLLKKLSSINTPKSLENGKQIASEIFLNNPCLANQPETLFTNLLPIIKIPEKIKIFRFNRVLNNQEYANLKKYWAHYKKDKNIVFAFQTPSDLKNLSITEERRLSWNLSEEIYGIPTINIVKNLLFRSIESKLYQKGLKMTESQVKIGQKSNMITAASKPYFPYGLLHNNKISFVGYTGRATWILCAGERGKIEKFRYHLSPKFKIKQDSNKDFFAQLNVHFYFTEINGEPLHHRSIVSKRKSIGKSLWNHQWLQKYFAIVSFIADGNPEIIMGDDPEEQIVISSKFIQLESPCSIIEDNLSAEIDKKIRKQLIKIDSHDLDSEV